MTAIRQTVQPGTTSKLRIEVSTDPAETGRAGAFVLREAKLDVDGIVTDLIADASWTMPNMVERAFKPSGAETASVTSTPSFSAGSGPAGEDVWTIAVDSSVGFEVGDHIRAVDQPDDEGQVYVILQIPTGTSLKVHGKTSGCDIASGDSIEEVISTGVYAGAFDFAVDDYLNAGDTTGQLRVLVQTIATGNAPKFDAAETLVWTFDLQLDIGSRAYRAG